MYIIPMIVVNPVQFMYGVLSVADDGCVLHVKLCGSWPSRVWFTLLREATLEVLQPEVIRSQLSGVHKRLPNPAQGWALCTRTVHLRKLKFVAPTVWRNITTIAVKLERQYYATHSCSWWPQTYSCKSWMYVLRFPWPCQNYRFTANPSFCEDLFTPVCVNVLQRPFPLLRGPPFPCYVQNPKLSPGKFQKLRSSPCLARRIYIPFRPLG